MPSAALECHPASSCSALRAITVSITRSSEALRITYVLEGEIDRLRIPPPRPPRVADGLWQHTCCEIFIEREGGPGYREFNFSPSGEWAAYAFERYREGRQPIDLAPRIVVRRVEGRLALEAALAVKGTDKLRVGLSAVVEESNGALSYWALRHAPGKPDFHHRAAFALELNEVRH